MRKLGNLDLVGNFLRNVGLEPVTEWPTDPQVGRFLNFRNRIYLCTELEGTDGLPVYIPVTSTVSTYLHTQTLASDMWVMQHGLNYDKPIVFVYDAQGTVIQADEIEILDLNTVTLQFSMPISGKAIVMCATDNLVNGGAANGGGVSNPLLSLFALDDGHLKFGTDLLQYQLTNADTLALLGIDGEGRLTYNGQAVGKQLSNSDILAKFSVVNGILFYDGAQVDNVGDTFTNASVLELLSVVNGELFYNGIKIDTVGDTYQNSDVLQKLSVVNGVLFYDGIKVDTVGHTFDNQAVLDKLGTDASGNLLYNGLSIGSGGTSLPNADVLEGFAVDINGALTYNGALLASDTQLALTVNNSGTGVNILKSVIGSDLYAKTLKAGSNITLDVTSDEIQINATLGGTVTASTTFKSTDAYTNTNVVANTSSSKILASEVSTSETGLLFLMRMGDDLKANITGTTPVASGSVSLVASTSMKNDKAANFNGGYIALPNTTANSATVPASWFAGVADWTIEFDVVRSSSNQGMWQSVFSSWAATPITACGVWLAFDATNKLNVCWAVGSTTYAMASASAITDNNKHHIEANRSGGVIRLFIDGVLSASVATALVINTATNTYYLGKSADATTTIPFYGQLRDFKVYNYAKHTSAYTVAGYYADRVGTINTVDMSGKLLSSAFWKTVTGLTVTSTETATAYLKWLVVTSVNTYGWDSTNSVFTAVGVENILTQGMTTTEIKAHFLNYGWNYMSDSVGLVCALVTTDGQASPVLTSIAFTAIQSADKTAGHTVESSTGTMPQRTVLHFENMAVTDDGNRTVVSGLKDSSQLTHNQQSLSAVVEDLVASKGKVGSISVDVTGVQQGSTVTYDELSGKFVTSLHATGSQGNGLYMTEVVSLPAGGEATVSHQQVNQGRAIYQAEEFIAAGPASNINAVGFNSGLTSAAPIFGQALRAQRQGFRLPATYTSTVKNAVKTLPQAIYQALVYQVDETIYLIGGRVTSTTENRYTQTAPASNPATVTKGTDLLPVSYADLYSGQSVFRVGDYLYRLKNLVYTAGVATIAAEGLRAPVSDPTNWTSFGTPDVYRGWAAMFIVGDYLYMVGGTTASTPAVVMQDIYRAKLNDMTRFEFVATLSIGYIYAPAFYQYGDYLYMLGGRVGSSQTGSATFSNKIYRASISDPTTWTQIGTLPISIAYTAVDVIGDRVILSGIRTVDATFTVASTYISDASNPVSWTALTAGTALAMRSHIVVDDTLYLYGGYPSSLVANTTIDSYTLTFTNTANRAVVYTPDYSLAPIQSISSVMLDASVPANTSIKTLVSFDKGVTWKYWSGTAFVTTTLNDSGFDLAPAATLSGSKYDTGVTGVFDDQTIRFAFQLQSTVDTVTPRIYAVRMNYVEAGSMMPLSVGAFTSTFADIGIKHRQGTYLSTAVKNLTSRDLELVLKVYDGYGAGV